MTESGWRQPPVHRVRRRECLHLGAAFASLTLAARDTGHEWVCGCGQVFVVVSNAGRDKRLVKDWRECPMSETTDRLAAAEMDEEPPLTEAGRAAIEAGRCGPLRWGGPCWLMPGHRGPHHCYREDIADVVAAERAAALREAADALDAESERIGGMYAGDCTELLRDRAAAEEAGAGGGLG